MNQLIKQEVAAALAVAALLTSVAAAPRSETLPETEMQEFQKQMQQPPETENPPEETALPETDGTQTEETTAAAEYRTTPCSWYCRHGKNGVQPPAPAEFPPLAPYDAYYIDRRHTEPDSVEKVLYLTFDAGYENGNIKKILDVLLEERVPGAFFILANLAKTNPELVKRMAAEGHLVCNHTAAHKDMTHVTEQDAFGAELRKMETICKEETGVTMAQYYRPPEGKFTEKNLADAKALGYKTVFWSFAYADWDNDRQMAPEKAIEKIMSGTHNGEVLLLHPTSATNAAILKELISRWKEAGYRFGTLDELCAAD